MPAFRPPDPRAWRAVLFDMNDTFMFGGDRFGPEDDLAATYQALGGSGLSDAQVRAAAQACLEAFWRDYADPGMAEGFPLLQAHVAAHAGLPPTEHDLLAQVLAGHEVGRVPEWAAQAVKRVAAVTAVGLVSNVWAPSVHWQAELRRCGLADLWRVAVFSSDIRAVKPSPKPFRVALDRLGLAPGDVLFVGDSLARDIRPARALGMGTCLVGGWVGADEADHCLARLDQMP